jgi:hypothetical protein
MSEYDPAIRTRTLARIIGPYLLIVGVALLTRPQMLAAMLPDFMHQSGLVFFAGAFTVLAGLILLTAHHHWTSPAAIVITLMGAAALLKGAWLMLAPEWGAEVTNAFVSSPTAMLAAAAFELLVGAWLTFVGWVARKPA